MIKADGKKIVASGNPVDLIQDYINITSSFRSMFAEKLSQAAADEIVSLCGRCAYAENPQEKEMYVERLAELLAECKRSERRTYHEGNRANH